jgi:hypothetical protein
MREYSAHFVSYMFLSLYNSMIERENVRASDDEMFSVFFESLPGFIY